MAEVQEGEPGEAEPGRAVPSKHQTSWSWTLRTLQRGWSSFAPVGVVWSVCQVGAPLHPSQLLVEVIWRLLLVGLLWLLLGGCVYVLRCRLQPDQDQVQDQVQDQDQGGTPLRIQQEVVTEDQNNECLWTPPPRSPGPDLPLAQALVDSLLLCLLQESLPDPSGPHLQALLSMLGSVCHRLGKADLGSEVDGDSVLMDKVKLLLTYLQQRLSSLSGLVQVQADFEAGVKDLLEGLEGLWAQLEELHTGVTLTKEGSRGHADLASTQTDSQTLFAVLGEYRIRLQRCGTHLKDSTHLLQELTWSHAHISSRVRSSSESVWPELLLQTNIEQFDKVQESFLSLDQQIGTFQAHLEGLGREDQDGFAGPGSRSVSPQTSSHLHSGRTSLTESRNSTSGSTSVSSAEVDLDLDPDPEPDVPLSLCERSALQVASSIERLRTSRKRK